MIKRVALARALIIRPAAAAGQTDRGLDADSFWRLLRSRGAWD
jgi:hypothetical protein